MLLCVFDCEVYVTSDGCVGQSNQRGCLCVMDLVFGSDCRYLIDSRWLWSLDGGDMN